MIRIRKSDLLEGKAGCLSRDFRGGAFGGVRGRGGAFGGVRGRGGDFGGVSGHKEVAFDVRPT